MHVVYLTDTPAEIGGAERNLAGMADAALRRGYRVTMVAPQATTVRYLRERVAGADARQLGGELYHRTSRPAARAAALLAQLLSLARALGRLAPEVLHINNGGYPGSDLCRIAPLAARLAGIPARVMTINSLPWSRGHLSHPKVQSFADAIVWRNLGATVCPSAAVMDGLVERRGMPPELGRLIYYGIGEPTIDRSAVASLRRRLAPGGELLIGMVSPRPEPEKGYDVFIEALAHVPQARGVLVGPHLGEEFIAHVRRLSLDDRLSFEGRQPAVDAYYAAMDVLVVPSTQYECMPFVILEAMAAGTPVVGSRLSGIPEAIIDGETGRTFPPGDHQALASILCQGSSPRQEWGRMGDLARRRYERCFTSAALSAALVSLYRELLAGRRRPNSAQPDPAAVSPSRS